MNYSEDARYYQFLVESAVESEKLKGFTTTLFAANEGVDVSKLFAIKEDVGDKIRNIWDKFIAFLNRVWAKFMDYTNRVIQNDKGWLEQYKDIILNKQPNDVDIEMRDYPTGIHNMTSMVIPAFAQVQNEVPVDAADISFKQKLIQEYMDGNQDWSSFCVAYFQGGPDKKSTNLKQMNMTDLYNYCHDYNKIEDAIKKDKDVISQTFQNVQNIITKAKNDAQQQPAAAQPAAGNSQPPQNTPPASNPAPTPPAPNPAPAPSGQQGGKQIWNKDTQKWEPANASYAIDNYIGSYFSEADDPQNNSRMTVGKPNANAAQNSTVTNADPTKASNNMKSTQTNAPAADGTPAPAANADGQDLDDLGKKITNYNSAASGVLTAKMTSAHVIYQDYMKILKMHVGQQVGKNGDEKIANAGSSYQGALKIDNPQGVLDQITAIDNEKDANNKSKLTQQLNRQIMASNPNFQGGIDAIQKAAQAALPKK